MRHAEPIVLIFGSVCESEPEESGNVTVYNEVQDKTRRNNQ
jgi:hypothetical protein